MYASNQTTNYDLSQWLPTDPVHHEDFNGDNAKLDAALAALDSAKADADDFDDLSSKVTTVTNSHNSLVFDVYHLQNEKGNCQIETTTYTGTGYHGSSHVNSLSFSDGTPVLVLVMGESNLGGLRMVRGLNTAQTSGFYSQVTVSWTDSGLSWYGGDDEEQMNELNRTYTVVALLTRD